MKKSIALKLYILFVIALLAAMGWALRQLWDFCALYQENCPETLLARTTQELSDAYGLDLAHSSVPVVDEAGNSVFAVKTKDGNKKVGDISLRIKDKGILSLALYEVVRYRGTLSFSVEAPEGISISVGGLPAEASEENKWPGSEELTVIKGVEEIPGTRVFRVSGLFSKDQIEIRDGEKILNLKDLEQGYPGLELRDITETARRTDPALSGSWKIIPRFRDPGDAEAVKQRAIKLAEMYSNFISKDLQFASFKKHISEGSPLIASLPTMEIQWYNWHTKAQIQNAVIDEPLVLSDDCVLVNTSYDYVITRQGKDYAFPIELALYLHLDDDGVWRLALLNTHLVKY